MHLHISFPAILTLALVPLLRAADSLPSPGELVADIVARHPELAFYSAEIEAAKAARRGAGAPADPELAVSAGHKRVRDPLGLLSGEGAAWSVSLTQTFEWPGRLALRKSIANRQVELAELGLARFRTALAARAMTLVHAAAVSVEKTAATREVADRFQALRELFVARDPAGLTPLLETRVIEAQEIALQRRATDAELAAKAALIEFNQLRGAPWDASVRATAASLRFNPAPALPALLVAAREKNFDFLIKRVELEQQGLQVSLARHERRPAITAGPFLARETAGDRETTLGLSLSVPLPLGGRTRGPAEAAEARRRQADAALAIAQRHLEREVTVAAVNYEARLSASALWQPGAIRKFRDAAELADRHYRLGAVPLATYVELQNAYLEAVDALLETKRAALEAGLQLQLLTGLDFKAAEFAP